MTSARNPLPWLLGVFAIVALAATAGAVVLLHRVDLTVTASSTAAGYSPEGLVEAADTRAAPAPAGAVGVGALIDDPGSAEATASDAEPVWRSEAGATSVWVQIDWTREVEVDRVRIDGAGGDAGRFTSALATFSDGSSVLLTADANGNVLVDIPARTTTSVQVRFTRPDGDDRFIGLAALAVDDGGSSDASATDASAPHVAATPRTSTPAGGIAEGAIADGDIAAGTVGETWRPADPADAWVGDTWDEPVAVSSVSIAGPESDAATAVRTGHESAAATSGRLVFSDGSSVAVSGIGAGADPTSTIAFAARMATWVRLEIDGENPEISEFHAYLAGQTPPRWPHATGYAVTAGTRDTQCGRDSSATVGTAADGGLALVCPEIGSPVTGTARIVVSGAPLTKLTASAWVPAADGIHGQIISIGTDIVDAEGRGVIEFDADPLPHGPFTVRIDAEGGARPLYAQLVNTGGVSTSGADPAPKGMTLQFSDDFDGPLSVTQLGGDARYAATKPAGSGGSEFGGAVFADPALGYDNLATQNGYLRIRNTPLIDEDPYKWERKFTSGLLSSLRVGGSGVSAQYGLIEARMLAPGGIGTWPAFWSLDTESAVKPQGPSAEVDAVELYGHNTSGTCHTIHNWPDTGDIGAPHCFDDSVEDWALQWHVYAARIRPGGADFYIDGQLVASAENLRRTDLPFYFMLNLSAGGGWPIDLTPTGGVADLFVDWVKVYS